MRKFDPHTEPHTIPDVKYSRVFPRDLFNEAKLLKCLGQLSLMVVDNKTPCEITVREPDGAIQIGLREDGFLEAVNIEITVKGNIYNFIIPYNSKSPYPLMVERRNVQYQVFDDSGEFDKEFIVFTKMIKP